MFIHYYKVQANNLNTFFYENAVMAVLLQLVSNCVIPITTLP